MRFRLQFVLALLLPGSFWLSVSALYGQNAASTDPHKATAIVATQTAPPAKPESQPPAPPRVGYQNGLLTIQAENSTLGDILRAVQHATGATIDSPGYASERVYAHLGPGAPRDVLASLLNGSRYDYILLGLPQQPNAVGRVMLTLRQNYTEPPVTATAAAANADTDNDSPDDSPPDREPVPEPPPAQAPAPEAGANPAQNPAQLTPAQPGVNPPANGQTPGQPQVKTPEQLLKELQQMQQQQSGSPR